MKLCIAVESYKQRKAETRMIILHIHIIYVFEEVELQLAHEDVRCAVQLFELFGHLGAASNCRRTAVVDSQESR